MLHSDSGMGGGRFDVPVTVFIRAKKNPQLGACGFMAEHSVTDPMPGRTIECNLAGSLLTETDHGPYHGVAPVVEQSDLRSKLIVPELEVTSTVSFDSLL